MSDLTEFVNQYVSQLEGPNSDNAFHSLIEASPNCLPLLQRACEGEKSASLRARIIEVMSHFRCEESAGFFAEMLYSTDAPVWKASVDALVRIGGRKARIVLEAAKARFEKERPSTSEQLEWTIEAIAQLRK